jgi:membrane protein
VLRDTFRIWDEAYAPRLAAAIAFYTSFSIAPLLLLAIALAGRLFDEMDVQARVLQELRELLGPSGGSAVEEMLRHARRPGAGLRAATLGLGAFLIGASALFAQLQESLNRIWAVQKRRGPGIWGVLRGRAVSFAMVLGVGFLLLASLLLSATLAAVGAYLGGLRPAASFLTALNAVLSYGLITGLFICLFKLLPDVRVLWKDVVPGAVLTTILFNLGKWGIGLYLGRSSVSSAYGAAGSFAVFLLWVYYTSQIVLLGASFTRAYARRKGHDPRPAAGADRVFGEGQAGPAESPADRNSPVPGESLGQLNRRDTETPMPQGRTPGAKGGRGRRPGGRRGSRRPS